MNKADKTLCKEDYKLPLLTQEREQNAFDSLEEKILGQSREIFAQIEREYDTQKSKSVWKELSLGFWNGFKKQSLEYKIRSHIRDIEKLITDRNIRSNMSMFVWNSGLQNVLKSSLRVQQKYKKLAMERVLNQKDSEVKHRLSLLWSSISFCEGSRV